MGFFDFFRKNKPTNDIPNDGVKHSDLYYVVHLIKQVQAPIPMREFSRVLRNYVMNGKWVYAPIIKDNDSSKIRLPILKIRDKAFIQMYSDKSEIKQSGTVVQTDINKLLDSLFGNAEIDGIVIDPDTSSMYFNKGFLLKCILHGYLQEQHSAAIPHKNWGNGIPDYSTGDLMTKGELLDFAIQTVLENEEELASYRLISSCNNTDAIPNLLFENNGRFILVAVKGYCAMETPGLSTTERNLLLRYKNQFNAKCFYAPVGFGSTDPMRFSAWLALKGDSFYAKYEGLELI